MSSKRAIRRRQCEGKVRHTRPANAVYALALLRQGKGYSGPMNVYHCKFCGGWHYGHAPRAR